MSDQTRYDSILTMEYISTRGSAPAIPSKKAIIKGIAEDDGLYVPSHFPPFGIAPFGGPPKKSYADRAVKILRPFLTDYTDEQLNSSCRSAYGKNFESPQTAPVKILGDGTAVLELWHGPTQAFKDMALQIMPLFDHHPTIGVDPAEEGNPHPAHQSCPFNLTFINHASAQFHRSASATTSSNAKTRVLKRFLA